MPDDHYSCKICGRSYELCTCPATVNELPATPRPISMNLDAMKGRFEPLSFTLDYRDNSVTWHFETADEADRFAKVVAKLIRTE